MWRSPICRGRRRINIKLPVHRKIHRRIDSKGAAPSLCRSHLTRLTAILGLSLLPATVHADVRLPALISDNMVLRQNTSANVWGWAEPGEEVAVTLDAVTARVVTAHDGHWQVHLDGLAASEHREMTVRGKNVLTVHNVAVGEVWVSSGQSNMDMPVALAREGEVEAAAADDPALRMFIVARSAAETPQDDCQGHWEICTPQNTRHFSAASYFFARHLRENLRVPVGMINASVGGTSAELWTPWDVLARDQQYQGMIGGWERLKKDYPQSKAAYDLAVAKWDAAMKTAGGAAAGDRPKPPLGGDAVGAPGCEYQGMIAPLVAYTIRGVIWYQGESNAGKPKRYATLFPSLIQSWRQRWSLGDFPFLYVQLANYEFADSGDGSRWAELREVQSRALSVPNTAMAVAIDLGEAHNIHPKNKQEVGRRLALLALARVYDQKVDAESPRFAQAKPEGGEIRITFQYGEGLKSSDGGALRGFEIAGADRQFFPAEAEFEGDAVLVHSPKVPQPLAVRYAWADNPTCNLVNAAGLPASPFRTDDWHP